MKAPARAKKAAAVKKRAVKKATKKKATGKPAKAAPALVVRSVKPSRDGSQWTVTLGDGSKRAVGAADAQSAGVGVGSAWTAALKRRLAGIALEQESFRAAMELLATRGRMGRAALVKALGGDARAKATVGSLAKNGWVR
ncbi:MAG: hypothetical protein ACKO0W_02375 [Planctomycetota bacterium]